MTMIIILFSHPKTKNKKTPSPAKNGEGKYPEMVPSGDEGEDAVLIAPEPRV